MPLKPVSFPLGYRNNAVVVTHCLNRGALERCFELYPQRCYALKWRLIQRMQARHKPRRWHQEICGESVSFEFFDTVGTIKKPRVRTVRRTPRHKLSTMLRYVEMPEFVRDGESFPR